MTRIRDFSQFLALFMMLSPVFTSPLAFAQQEIGITKSPVRSDRSVRKRQRAPMSSGYSDQEIVALMSGDERKIADIRRQEIEQLKITLSRRQPVARRADLYLRLAEVYIEAYRFEFLLEGRAHEQRLERGLPSKTIDRSRSKPYLLLAIQACQEILDFKIPYAQLDQVLYFLAYNYSELGDASKAESYYAALVKAHPQSVFAAEGWRELGEARFEARDYRGALPLFGKALERIARSSEMEGQKPRIRHRIAWCLYRLKQYDRAIVEMKEAISLSAKSGERFLSVKEEALRDLAVFMTESGNVDEAIVYFRSAAGDQSFYPRVLESLGRQYERNVEPQKATQVYESLLKTHPKDEAAFRVRVKLVDLDLRRGNQARALERLEAGKLYPSSDGETETAWQNLRAMIRRTATESHEKFRREADRQALEVAARFYERYLNPLLKLSDPRKETPEIQMYLADVKRELGAPQEASALYRQVVESGDKRYAKEAAALWTASLADAIRKEAQKDQAGAAKRLQPTALEREFIQAADDLQKSIKDSQEAREARVRAAQVLAAYPETQKEALKRARGLIEEYPRSSQALVAARLWIQLSLDRVNQAQKAQSRGESTPASSPGAQELTRQVEELASVVTTLRQQTALLSFDSQSGGKVAAALVEADSRLRVAEIAAREQGQDFSTAAKLYETYAQETKDRDAAAKALENAVASWVRQNDLTQADRVVRGWLKRFPESAPAIQAWRNLATLQFIAGDFTQSASSFEQVAILKKDPELFETAIRIRSANEDVAPLVARYLERFPQSPTRAQMLLNLGRAQEEAGKPPAAMASYRQCAGLNSEESLECTMRLGLLLQSQGKATEATVLFKRLASGKLEGRGAYFQSWAKWELARIAASAIRFSKLSSQGWVKELPRRLQAFEKLQKNDAAVLEGGGSFSVAASRRLGKVALDLATELQQLIASESSGTGVQQVQQIVQTLRTTALQFFKQSQQKASQNLWLSAELPRLIAEIRIAERQPVAQGAFPRCGFSGKSESAESIQALRQSLAKNPSDASGWARYARWLGEEQGQVRLGVVAAERSLSLAPKNPVSLNVLACLQLGVWHEGASEGLAASHALQIWNEALKGEGATTEIKRTIRLNQAMLLNYYGQFGLAKKLLDFVNAAERSSLEREAWQVALLGLGDFKAVSPEALPESGESSLGFSSEFHSVALGASQNPAQCLEQARRLHERAKGFEKAAWQQLEEACQLWKGQASS
ncbi:MAG: hypothetical protein RJB38_1477 [Pseudomonadota bacterium]